MHISYYEAELNVFFGQSSEEILGILTLAHKFALEGNQRDVWRSQIAILKSELGSLNEGIIHFEFIIPRMGKRADCVLLYRDFLFVLEFKVGAECFDRSAMMQVHDYALDLKNFHLGSHNATIVPILIATRASATIVDPVFADDGVAEPLLAGKAQLKEMIEAVAKHRNANPTRAANQHRGS